MADFSGGVFRLNDNKAGMQLEGLSKDDVSRILTEASEGSRFHESKKVKQKAIEERIASKKCMLEKASAEELAVCLQKADAVLEQMDKSRNLSRTIVHVDMDMFYAAVEMRDDPSLKDKPVAVGGMSMLSTSNYNARKFGVRAAQPGFLAKKLCPDLVIIPCNFSKYRAVAAIVRQVFAEYDPNYSTCSLDEAYLDITDHVKKRSDVLEEARTMWRCDCVYWRSVDPNFVSDCTKNDGPSEEVLAQCPACGRSSEKIIAGTDAEGAVLELRTKVFQRTALTCSAGFAADSIVSVVSAFVNKLDEKLVKSGADFSARVSLYQLSTDGLSLDRLQNFSFSALRPSLAKICTDKNKPNGQYKLPSDRATIMAFVEELPVRKVPGIGAATEEVLRALDISTCSDLRRKRDIIALTFSELSLEHFMRVSLGLGSVVLGGDEERKSISTERTYRELWKPDDLLRKLGELTKDLVESMEEENICGKCVTIKIKLITFESRTRAHTVPHLIRRFEEIYPVAKKLLETEIRHANGKLRTRLMGIRMSQLQPIGAEEPLRQSSISKFLSAPSTKSETSPVKPPPPEKMPAVRSADNGSLLPDGDAKSSSSLSSDCLLCPNCGATIRTDANMVRLNHHLDRCLNQEVVDFDAGGPSSVFENVSSKRLRLDEPPANRKPAKRKPQPPRKITDYFRTSENT